MNQALLFQFAPSSAPSFLTGPVVGVNIDSGSDRMDIGSAGTENLHSRHNRQFMGLDSLARTILCRPMSFDHTHADRHAEDSELYEIPADAARSAWPSVRLCGPGSARLLLAQLRPRAVKGHRQHIHAREAG